MPFAEGNGYIDVVIYQLRTIREHEYLLDSLIMERRGKNGEVFMFTDKKGKILVSSKTLPGVQGKTIFDIGLPEEAWTIQQDTPFFVSMKGDFICGLYCELNDGKRVYELLSFAGNSISHLLMACVSCLVLLLFLYIVQTMMQRTRKMQARVDKLITEKLERHQQEINLARDIQRNELRTDVSDTPYSLIHSYIKPEEEVGGDFYDYYALPDGRFVCMIADVSGHGVAAAFFMMKTKITLREKMLAYPSLTEAVDKVNQMLYHDNAARMFVTAWIGVMDPRTGRGEYISAGHNPPLWYHCSDDRLDWVPGTGSMALGVSANAKFKVKPMDLKRGDRLFLYTDGITEAKNISYEQFSPERLKKVLTHEHGSYITRVQRELQIFTAGAPQTDDITMVQVYYKGSDVEQLQEDG